jgi:basic membrane protein A and related proteins
MKVSVKSAPRAFSLSKAAIVLCVLALALTVGPQLLGRTTAVQAKASAFRVGIVFDVGGRGDKSFNDSAYEGLVRAERELGIEGMYLEPEKTEDRESALRLFASRGYDLIIGVGFIFSSDVDTVARDYPNVSFACVDYFSSSKEVPNNVTGLSFREEEGSFLVGAVAGLMTKRKTVGFVGGMTGPLIRKFEVGFQSGVESVCPDCTTRVGYVGTTPEAYHDPAKGKALALSQIASNADIVYHASGATGRGVFEGCREGQAFAIGVDSDQYEEMPKTVLTSMVKRVDNAVFQAIAERKQGRLTPGLRSFGLAEGGVDYVKEGPHATEIPESVKQRVLELAREVERGQRKVPSQ